MVELDQPTSTAVTECGEPMSMSPQMGMTPPPVPHNPPTLSVNLNAQGMDDIESIMRLMTKVNPDMINQPEPAGEPMGLPSLTPPGPSISSIGDLGNLDKGPLKMLPDLDKQPEVGAPDSVIDIEPMTKPDADKMNPADDEGGDDGISVAQGDVDNDGDHDMDDHKAEKEKEDEGAEPEKDDDDIMNHLNKELKPFDDQQRGQEEEEEEEEADEAYGNSPAGASGPDYKDTEYMTKDLAGGMNREKKQFKHSYKAGDNPMAMPESDLRAYIKAELSQRLEEAKASIAERDMGKHNNGSTGFKAVAKNAAKEYGSKEAGERVAGAVKAKMAKAGKL